MLYTHMHRTSADATGRRSGARARSSAGPACLSGVCRGPPLLFIIVILVIIVIVVML